MKNTLFKPRDFIYINKTKLNSYFSQLYGGLIKNIDNSDFNETKNFKGKKFNIEVASKFGLGDGSVKLIDFLLKQIGNLDVSGKGIFNADYELTNKNGSSLNTQKTLEHFQYALFEQSMYDLGYLIDLNQFHSKNPKIQSGQIRENLTNSDFIKYTASTISISDYRNASEFIKLLKRVIDLSIDYKIGDLIDKDSSIDRSLLRQKATVEIASTFTEGLKSDGLSEKFNTIVEAINEFFNGDMIPHDILLTSELQLGNNGKLTFESQLRDQFLLEARTELAYKYGLFEDVDWTIVGQVTSVKNPKTPSFNEVIEQTGEKMKHIFSEHKTLNINSTVKEIVSEIDKLTKKVGLLPLVNERSIAITPIAIFREPKRNNFFIA